MLESLQKSNAHAQMREEDREALAELDGAEREALAVAQKMRVPAYTTYGGGTLSKEVAERALEGSVHSYDLLLDQFKRYLKPCEPGAVCNGFSLKFFFNKMNVEQHRMTTELSRAFASKSALKYNWMKDALSAAIERHNVLIYNELDLEGQGAACLAGGTHRVPGGLPPLAGGGRALHEQPTQVHLARRRIGQEVGHPGWLRGEVRALRAGGVERRDRAEVSGLGGRGGGLAAGAGGKAREGGWARAAVRQRVRAERRGKVREGGRQREGAGRWLVAGGRCTDAHW